MKISRDTLSALANGNTSEHYKYFKIYVKWCHLEDARKRIKYRKTEVQCHYDVEKDEYMIGIVFDPHLFEKQPDAKK